MCGYFCIRFIDFVQKGKTLSDYANSFSTNEYEKNDKRILQYFQQLETKYLFSECIQKKMIIIKSIILSVINKDPKRSYIFYKTLVLSIR